MSHAHSHRSEAVGGPIVTRSFLVLAAIAAVGLLFLGRRFVEGLGATTNLNDGYPWGIWIAFDMVVGTALATGGYGIALLVYVMNRGRYHPLIRSALLTSALGYTLGGIAVVIDLGRYWSMWKLPVEFWRWNLSSILLEVALCVMIYTAVLWIELSPALLERWKDGGPPRLQAFSAAALPKIEKALPWVIALGILLPTMHQSSLGSLMLLSGWKLHPLWNTPLLPLLFLVSCLAMGFAVVTMESLISSLAFGRPRETALLARLGRVAAGAIVVYLVIRLGDLALRGRLWLAFAGDRESLLFWTEILLLAGALPLLRGRSAKPAAPGRLFRAAMLIAMGGILYRFSTFLIAYQPGEQWSYFPGVQEILVTAGLFSLELMAYTALVKRFPILAGAAPRVAFPTPPDRTRVAVPGIVSDMAFSRGERK